MINLSEWALRSRSLVAYIMIVAVIAGAWSYFKLGRSEDPAFIIKTMVVQAAWPGATVEETLKQVTERLERKLQETPHLDFLRSFTRAGVTTIFVNLKGSASAKEVADTWYQVRKNVGDIRSTLPAGIVGPGFNDDFGDTFGIIYGFTSDGFTHRELRDHVEDIRSKLLLVPDVSKIELLGAQDERIFVEFSMKELASLGIDRSALIAALQAQNIVRPAGTIETGNESLSLRVSGAFVSEQDVANINFVVGGRILRLSDIAHGTARLFRPAAAACFASTANRLSGLRSPCGRAGTFLRSARTSSKVMARVTADLPIGIEPKLVADQAVTVDGAISEFMTSLLQAIAIILVVSFISLGVRPGLIIALSIPLTLAIVFPIMKMAGIDMQRISLGALIIALALLVDDAMTTTDATLNRLATRRRQGPGGDIRIPDLCNGYACGHAGDDRRFRAGRLCGQFRRRIHVLALRGGQHRTDRVLVRCGDFCAAAGRHHSHATEGSEYRRSRQGFPLVSEFPHLCHAGEMADDYRYLGAFRGVLSRASADPPAILSVLGSSGIARRSQPAAECVDLCQRNRGAAPRCRPEG